MGVTEREEMLVARLRSLAPHLDGEPDPAFRAATRARLVAMAAVRSPEPEPASRVRRLLTGGPVLPSRWRTRLTAGLTGAALTVTALATVVAVSSGAHPGDALYALKRSTEQAQLALAGDSRGEVLLEFARARLEELRALDGDAELVVATLGTMDAQTTEGAGRLTERAVATEDEAPLETLDDWAEVQSASLAAVRADMPPSAQDEVQDSLALLADISSRADGLRVSLDCPDGPSTTGSDGLGPVPGLCVPEGTDPATPPGDAAGGGGSGDPGTPAPGTGVPAPRITDPTAPSAGGAQPGLPGTDGPDGGVLDPLAPSSPPLVGEVPLPSLTVPSLPGTTAEDSPGMLPGEDTTPDTDLDVDLCLPPVASLGDC